MPKKVFSVRVMIAQLQDCLDDGVASLSDSEVDMILLDRAAEQRNEPDKGGSYASACKVCGKPVGPDGHLDLADIDGVVTITAAYCAEHWRRLGE
jgi:hypothetical protein